MSSWVNFFKDAAIPSPVAKNYATIFEDNRITKDMLLDLNKEILTDMGIKVMGDIIGILKHAKKVHAQETRKKEHSSTGSNKPTVGTSSPAHTTAAVSTTSSTKRTKTSQPTTAGYTVSEAPADSWAQEPIPPAPVIERLSPEITYVTYEEAEPGLLLEPDYGSLRSDELLQDQAVQHELQQEPALEYYLKEASLSDLLSAVAESSVEVEPEYTTAAYERNQRKRLIGTMYSDEVSDYGSRTGLTPTKQPRVVLLPGEGQDISPPSRSSQPRVVLLPGEGQDISPPSRSSQPRVVLLPGEGQDISPPSRSSHATTDRSRRLLEAAGLFPSQKEKIIVGSVFSRLGHSSSSTKPVKVDTSTRTVAAESSFPKPRLTVSTRDTKPTARDTRPSARDTRPSASREQKAMKSRIVASTSRMASDSLLAEGDGKVLSRLGVRERTARTTAQREKNPAKPRDGGTSRSAQQERKPKPSMVADEYETKRQLDIRSRLEKKESEKRARRRGVLSGRLGEHHVFGRLE